MIGLRDRIYAPVLKFAINQRFLTLVIIFSTLVLTIGAIGGGIVRTTFFPDIEGEDLSVSIKLPAGTTEETTYYWLNHLEEAAWSVSQNLQDQYFPEGDEIPIKQIEKIVGPSTYEGRLNISLLDGEKRRDYFTIRDVTNAIREEAGPIYDAEQVAFGAFSPFGKPISVSLVGPNIDELNAASEALKGELNKLSELSDIFDSNQEGLREIEVSLNDKALYLGLNIQEIIGQVRQGFFGREVQRLQRGRDEVKVWVRYAEEERSNIGQLQNMRVRFADGREFPLSEIATLEEKRGVISINHLDGLREIRVEADVNSGNASVSDITANIENKIVPEILDQYPTVMARYEGQNAEQEKSTASMQKVMPLILLMMFFVIALTFRSLSQTLIVFAILPFGLVGVAWGHWFQGLSISLFSILGFIALVGVLVNDALVFITTYNQNLKEGLNQEDALFKAGISRFRPIVLTSVTTVAGLAPLLLEKSFQAQFLIPMAVSVAYGLLSVTVIILVLLPTLLTITNRIKVQAIKIWDGREVAYKDVEAAVEGREYRIGLWLVAGLTMLIGFAMLVFFLFKITANIF